MYVISGNTQRCISNNKAIIQQVVIKWNRKLNRINHKFQEEGYEHPSDVETIIWSVDKPAGNVIGGCLFDFKNFILQLKIENFG